MEHSAGPLFRLGRKANEPQHRPPRPCTGRRSRLPHAHRIRRQVTVCRPLAMPGNGSRILMMRKKRAAGTRRATPTTRRGCSGTGGATAPGVRDQPNLFTDWLTRSPGTTFQRSPTTTRSSTLVRLVGSCSSTSSPAAWQVEAPAVGGQRAPAHQHQPNPADDLMAEYPDTAMLKAGPRAAIRVLEIEAARMRGVNWRPGC